MDEVKLVKEICQKEIEYGCYDAKIDNVSIYSYVRHNIRSHLLSTAGFYVMDGRNKLDKVALLISVIKSFCQIVKLICLNRHYTNVFSAFARVETVGGAYIDKFTDPIIDCCELHDYIIFDRGKAGTHPQPRIHSDKILYIEFVQIAALILSRFYRKYFFQRHRDEFEKLNKSLCALTDSNIPDGIYTQIVAAHYYSKLFGILLKRIKARNVLGPTRSQQTNLFVAAKKLGIKTFEIQHGISYHEDTLYAGYRDPMIVPDFFLAYGNNDPMNVYGIDEKRIKNVGFALFDYLKNKSVIKRYEKNEVLVISDPGITEVMIKVVSELSDQNPLINFYFRPHPHEFLTEVQIKKLTSRNNVFIHDTSVNIIEALYGFENVIGESSTTLYEALSMRRKVGKLHYPGLNPLYLTVNDRKDFWQISNQNEFEIFLKGELPSQVRSIYSPFDKNKLLMFLSAEN